MKAKKKSILIIGCSVALLLTGSNATFANPWDDGYKEGRTVGVEWAGSGTGVPTVATLDQVANVNAQRNDVQPAELEQWVKAFKTGFEAGYKAADQKAFGESGTSHMTDTTILISGITGAAISIVSGLIGAWAGARWNFRYQQKLLDQQLEFQRKSQEQTESFIRTVTADITRTLETIARRSPGGIGHPDTNPATRRSL